MNTNKVIDVLVVIIFLLVDILVGLIALLIAQPFVYSILFDKSLITDEIYPKGVSDELDTEQEIRLLKIIVRSLVLAVIILTGFYAYIHCAVFRKLFKKYTKVKDDTSNMGSYKIYTKYLKIDYDNI